MNINNLSTKDLKENKKFDDFYDEWWDLSGPFEPLHKFNKIRIDFIKKNLNLVQNKKDFKLLKNIKILDIGCGGGILCEPLARLGAKVTGIDTSKKAISIAKIHSKKNNLKIEYQNKEVTEFKSKEKFDVILCMEVLEHVNDIKLFLNCINKLMVKKGRLIGSTINKTISSYLFAIFFAENILKIIPKNTHSWKKFISPNQIKAQLFLSSFSKVKIKGSTYNPITKVWNYSSSDKINYFFTRTYL